MEDLADLARSSAQARYAEMEASGALCGEPVAPDERAAAVHAACDADLNRRDACGDGDQTPLRLRGPQDAVAQRLKSVWGNGGDFLEALSAGRLGVCLRSAALGNAGALAAALAKAKAAGAEALSEALERRETLLRWTPLDGAVMGAIQFGKQQGGDHVKVARLLLEHKARPDVRDVCGYTPLARCVTSAANDTTLEIGMLLIEHGADANSRNRFGDTPLGEIINSNRPDCAMLVCEGGADPMLPATLGSFGAPLNSPLLEFPAWMNMSEVLGHAVTRKSVTGSFKLAGTEVTLHGLSRHELNGKCV
jgi:hypothetical protein